MTEEALNAVENINQEIYDFLEKEYGIRFPILNLETDGFSILITFMGNYVLWFSEEDEREFNANKNEYEPLEQYLRREAQKLIDQIGSIKIKK